MIAILEEMVKQYSVSLYMEVAATNLNALNLYRKLGYDCLNTITIRKDFNPDEFHVQSEGKLANHSFEIKEHKKLP